MSKFSKVYYYWFHHNAIDRDKLNWIKNKILEHDWEALNIVVDLYDHEQSPYKLSTDGEPMTYFPDYVFVYYKEDLLSHAVRLTDKIFKMISDVDHEYG